MLAKSLLAPLGPGIAALCAAVFDYRIDSEVPIVTQAWERRKRHPFV